jgi:two-component system chemotaxis response regulator CheB
MPKIRILAVDDSAANRSIIAGILSSSGDIEVIGEASDGIEAVESVKRLRPDLVTLDIDMPRMNGLEATRRIMADSPVPIVIVSGSESAKDVDMAIEALAAGAVTVVSKPVGPLDPRFSAQAREMVQIVRSVTKIATTAAPEFNGRALSPAAESRVHAAAGPKRIVALVASGGGVQALATILSRLPADFPAPVAVVQQLAEGFRAALVECLGRSCPLSVSLARDGQPLQPRQVVLAPDGYHLGVRPDGTMTLSDSAPIQGCRPSGTFLLRSVAESYGPGALAAILTGMGRDGAEGAAHVRHRGGTVIAQDRDSSAVFAMPAAVIAAESAHAVLPLEEIAGCLIRLTRASEART